MSDAVWGLIGVGIGAAATLAATWWQQKKASEATKENQVREGVTRVVAERHEAATREQREVSLARGRLQADLAVLRAIVSELERAREGERLVPPMALEPPRIYDLTYLYFGEANVELQRYWRSFRVYESAFERVDTAEDDSPAKDRARDEQARLVRLAEVLEEHVTQALGVVEAFSRRLSGYTDDVKGWERRVLKADGVGDLRTVLSEIQPVPSLIEA